MMPKCIKMAELPGRCFISGEPAQRAQARAAAELAQDAALARAERDERANQVLQALRDGAESAAEVADAINLSALSVGQHLRWLLRQGKVMVLNPEHVPSGSRPKRWGVATQQLPSARHG